MPRSNAVMKEAVATPPAPDGRCAGRRPAAPAAEPNPMPYRTAEAITPVQPLVNISTINAAIVTRQRGHDDADSPSRSDSFPANGRVNVSVTAKTRKNVPAFTSIDCANSGRKVMTPP